MSYRFNPFTGTFDDVDILTTGTTGQVLLSQGTTGPATWGSPVTAGTATAVTGTSVPFTGIPSWVREITITISGLSTNGTSPPLVQLGTSGGYQTTNYLGANSVYANGTPATVSFTTGFGIGVNTTNWSGAAVVHGRISLSLVDSSNGTWSCNGILAGSNGTVMWITAGSKVLSGTLDRLRITTSNGTDSFDSGTVNILYK